MICLRFFFVFAKKKPRNFRGFLLLFFPGLFGLEDYILNPSDFDFSRVSLKMRKIKVTAKDLIELIYNPNTKIFGINNEYNFFGFAKKVIPLSIYSKYSKGKIIILDFGFAFEDDIKYLLQ